VTLKQFMTSPEAPKSAEERHRAFAPAAVVETGIATRFWLELAAYPPGSARSLWLLVNGSWRHMDNPLEGTQAAVQSAFCVCPDCLEVAVWYSGEVIVGLVVRSK